jgi:uncharacterized iron-regulated membrane protein
MYTVTPQLEPMLYRHELTVAPLRGAAGRAGGGREAGGDTLHRTLHLGDLGRNYSELAASWLWVEVLAGLALWLGAPRTRRRLRRLFLPRPGTGKRRHSMSWHGAVGLWAAIGLLGLSATGMTWSAHAGANIRTIRAATGMTWSPAPPKPRACGACW